VGIDLNGVQLLIRARRDGVSFERVATLGHQMLAANRQAVVSVLTEAGFELSKEHVHKLLDPASKYSDYFLSLLGAKDIVAIDVSAYEGAQIVHDMNQPIPQGLLSSFDIVLDGGTLEHVFDFPTALRNAAQMVRPDGWFISITMANDFCGHGFYQFSPELFYRFFCQENGYAMEPCIMWEDVPGSRFYEAPDPDSLCGRIELTSECGTYMMVKARRMGDVPRDFIPQQSDYVRLWDEPAKQTQRPGNMVKLKSLLMSFVPVRRLQWIQKHRALEGYRSQRIKRRGRNILKPLEDLWVLR
jgi:SAM-dependent methyltransferase